MAFSLYVVMLSLVRGSTRFDRYHMSAWSIIATYFAVGCVGGITLGLLRPLSRWTLGVALMGWVIGTFVYGGIGIVMQGFGRQQMIDGMVLGALVGPLVAILARRQLA